MMQSVFSLVKRKIRSLTNLKSEQFEQFFGRRFFRIDVGLFFVLLFIIVYAMVFSYFTVLKHNVFRSYAWDLGMNDQVFWTTLNEGKLFYSTPELFFNPSGSYFGLHFSPIMFLVLPVYAINQAPEALLVFQSFLLGIGALPLYLLARDGTNSKLMGVTFALTYLLYPILHGINWFDFHVQAFLPVVFFSAIYFLMHEKWLKFYFFIFLSLMIAENVSFVVLFVGLYTIWLYRKPMLQAIKQRGIIDRRILVPPLTIAMAIFWFLAVRWIQNTFFPLNPNFSQFYRAVNYHSVLGVGSDPVLLPVYVILNPLRALEALAYDAYLKLAFVLLLFGGLLFLPFRSSISFITLAWLGPALLSNYQPYYMMGDHYPAYVIPFVFAAAVYAVGKYRAKGLSLSKLGSQARNLLIVGVLFSLFASPITPLLGTTSVLVPYFSEYGAPVPTEHIATLFETIQLVPSNASVLTQNNLFPHFSSRANAYVLPLPDAMEFAPFAMNSYVNRLLNESEYVLIDTKTDEYKARELIFSRIGTLNFSELVANDGIYLFRRN